MLELLLIVLLLMLLRTATATLLLSFYYQPGTKHRSHTHTDHEQKHETTEFKNFRNFATGHCTTNRFWHDFTPAAMTLPQYIIRRQECPFHWIAVGGLIRLPPRSTLQLRPCPRSPNSTDELERETPLGRSEDVNFLLHSLEVKFPNIGRERWCLTEIMYRLLECFCELLFWKSRESMLHLGQPRASWASRPYVARQRQLATQGDFCWMWQMMMRWNMKPKTTWRNKTTTATHFTTTPTNSHRGLAKNSSKRWWSYHCNDDTRSGATHGRSTGPTCLWWCYTVARRQACCNQRKRFTYRFTNPMNCTCILPS